jgi:hypothetical protein
MSRTPSPFRPSFRCALPRAGVHVQSVHLQLQGRQREAERTRRLLFVAVRLLERVDEQLPFEYVNSKNVGVRLASSD